MDEEIQTPEALSIGSLVSGLDPGIAAVVAQRKDELREKLKNELLLQKKAEDQALTSTPDPMTQGISSAIIAAIPYLVGRGAGGTEGGVVGADLGLKATDVYRQNLQRDQERQGRVSDLYLRRSTALENQLNQLTSREVEAINQAENRQLGRERLEAQIEERSLRREEREEARQQAQMNREAIFAQRKVTDEQRKLLMEQRLATAKTTEEKAQRIRELGIDASSPSLANGYMPGGEKAIAKAFGVPGVSATVQRRMEWEERSTSKANNLKKVITLQRGLASGNISNSELVSLSSSLIGELKKPSEFNYGAALTDSEKRLLENLVGTLDPTNITENTINKVFGVDKARVSALFAKAYAAEFLLSSIKSGIVPTGAVNWLEPWSLSTKEDLVKPPGGGLSNYEKSWAEFRKTLNGTLSMSGGVLERMVDDGVAKDKEDAERQVMALLTGSGNIPKAGAR